MSPSLTIAQAKSIPCARTSESPVAGKSTYVSRESQCPSISKSRGVEEESMRSVPHANSLIPIQPSPSASIDKPVPATVGLVTAQSSPALTRCSEV